MRKKHKEEDKIFRNKEIESLKIISFLKALDVNLNFDVAFKISCDAFNRYMINYHENALNRTQKGTQERFDEFRKLYKDYSKKSPYVKIIESTPQKLKVKYLRCPFHEVLTKHALEKFTYSFCLSDPVFTNDVLPNVKFSRDHVIAKGDDFCDHTWEFDMV